MSRKVSRIAEEKRASGTETVIPARELGGILNATLENAIRKQQEGGIRLKMRLFDIPTMHDLPWEKRLELLHRIVEILPPEYFDVAPQETDPRKMRELFDRIRRWEHPETTEGIVIRSPGRKNPLKVKFREPYRVWIRSIFPQETGELRGKVAGGFRYSLSSNPKAKIVGEVGTGFTAEMRRDMWQHPEQWIGRMALVDAEEQFPSGALRAPSFQYLHEDYPEAQTAVVKKADSPVSNEVIPKRATRPSDEPGNIYQMTLALGMTGLSNSEKRKVMDWQDSIYPGASKTLGRFCEYVDDILSEREKFREGINNFYGYLAAQLYLENMKEMEAFNRSRIARESSNLLNYMFNLALAGQLGMKAPQVYATYYGLDAARKPVKDFLAQRGIHDDPIQRTFDLLQTPSELVERAIGLLSPDLSKIPQPETEGSAVTPARKLPSANISEKEPPYDPSAPDAYEREMARMLRNAMDSANNEELAHAFIFPPNMSKIREKMEIAYMRLLPREERQTARSKLGWPSGFTPSDAAIERYDKQDSEKTQHSIIQKRNKFLLQLTPPVYPEKDTERLGDPLSIGPALEAINKPLAFLHRPEIFPLVGPAAHMLRNFPTAKSTADPLVHTITKNPGAWERTVLNPDSQGVVQDIIEPYRYGLQIAARDLLAAAGSAANYLALQGKHAVRALPGLIKGVANTAGPTLANVLIPMAIAKALASGRPSLLSLEDRARAAEEYQRRKLRNDSVNEVLEEIYSLNPTGVYYGKGGIRQMPLEDKEYLLKRLREDWRSLPERYWPVRYTMTPQQQKELEAALEAAKKPVKYVPKKYTGPIYTGDEEEFYRQYREYMLQRRNERLRPSAPSTMKQTTPIPQQPPNVVEGQPVSPSKYNTQVLQQPIFAAGEQTVPQSFVYTQNVGGRPRIVR